MTPAEHRAEAERLHAEAIVLQGRGFYDHAARTYCVTMAHAKRLQAKWHERRSSNIGIYGIPTVHPQISWRKIQELISR